MFDLEQQGYALDESTKVWGRPNFAGIAYSDGDASEVKLAKIIREANDVSVLSQELSQHCTDWATLYHLSSSRGNILRPFESYLGGSTLEIGAGCGAISRYLGECGGQVLSLEGSPRRAKMAASRTRDLDNVVVLAERFDDFKTEHKFDVITLIGVLEYASMFSSAEDPALGMLQRIRSLLKPGGHLFIAIENQLGLKYFAGAPEDHLGVPMYGIEGRYIKGQPKTFGRLEIAALIKKAGFSRTDFLSPSPDYKLPNSITTERGLASKSFDASALAWQNVKKDPQLPAETFFKLEQAWPVVIDNGLGMDMANSFLISAALDDKPALPAEILAFHYSTGRKPAYCKESSFVETASGIEVQYSRIQRASAEKETGEFRYILPERASYIRGHVLSGDFLKVAATPDWTIQDFGEFLKRYVDCLQALLLEQGIDTPLDNVSQILPGYFLDAVPQNIVIQEDQTPALIDIEWEMTSGLPLGHLLMRALLLLIASATPEVTSSVPYSRRQFIIEIFGSGGLQVTSTELDGYIATEAQFQEQVTGRSAETFLNWAPDEPINQKKQSGRADMQAKIYYSDEHGNFSEESTEAIKIAPGVQTISFDFPDFEQVPKHIRIDPVDTRISFSINHMRLLSNGQVVWTWSGRLDELRNTSGLLQLARPDCSGFLLSMDDDPSFQLPVDLTNLQTNAQFALELEIVLHTDERVAQELKLDSQIAPQEIMHEPLQLLLGINKKLNHLLTDKEARLKEAAEEIEACREHNDQALKMQEELNLKATQLEQALQKKIMEDQVLSISETHLGQLNDKEVHIQNLISDHARQLAEKDTHIHNLNLQAIAWHSSLSFKITRPLRSAARALRMAKRATTLLRSIVQRNGGLSNALKKALKTLRSGGISELKARILNSRIGYGQTATANNLDETPEEGYAAWVRAFDTLTNEDRDKARTDIAQWHNAPLISILMPVYNPPLEMLEEAVKSVQTQLYTNWQLCIADDASTNPQVKACLKRLSKTDKRINVVYREKNGHICNATNSTLDIAKGEYVALMDNDDLLPEHALYWIARTVVENPGVALIYSDEDKIDVHGNRSAPYFKTDWNMYLFRSHNMISHLGAYRRDLVEQVGRFRLGMEGSQDYDLALRCVEKVKDEQIVHIPRVLYHWRIHAGSTALSPGEKPYAQLAGQKALDEHLQRIGVAGNTELLDFGMYRVHYDLPPAEPLVSLIIPTRNAHGLVKQCIDSIVQKTAYKNYEIILVDNGSDEVESLNYFSELDQQSNIRVIRDDGPFNYSALNNRAVAVANGELIGLVNNDIEVINAEWLGEMVSLALQPGAGAVGARLWYPDDTLQHGGIIMGPLTLAGHAHKHMPRGHHGYFGRASLIQGMSAVTAACLVVRKAVFQEVGGLNENELKIAFNDVDLCLKIKGAGYQNIWTPNADLYHHESATRGVEDTPDKRERFMSEVHYMQQKWKDIIAWDPVYNPNLSFETEDFGIASVPRISRV
ncbi:glycosyltransferase [Pseudomonas folii]|uniref:Glycosyltransferase n=1 Tax=Pseudomonas folii TaxID=2762593 RepID=A0ABR7AWE0_9PSED|nr:glycosyltransferase [Pseudomonas folii]MBC3949224.1 glycosyltransferase [Pseudomonas folii]